MMRCETDNPRNEQRLKPPQSLDHAPVWLAEAIQWSATRGATDVHFFPGEAEGRLWVRVDGDLAEVARYSMSFHQRMIQRLKVMGRCTDYDGSLVMEGRFALNGTAESGEVRLSVLPTLRGDKAVLRLLTGGGQLRRLGELGYGAELIAALRKATAAPQGLVLAIGPSGCGKSTALYAMLADLVATAGRPVSITTIEDPVEQTLPDAAQISIDPAHGLSFAGALRAVLRQDPEAIMIGEIRDAETAGVALQAALTGHRLFSSIHTQSAAEAFVRLRQMGMPSYVIGSALAGVLNTRLVRLLCPGCRREREMTESELREIPEAGDWGEPAQPFRIAESPGCDACLGGGHHGRTAVGEWIEMRELAVEDTTDRRAMDRMLRARVAARPAALELLRDGRIALAELRRIGDLSSMRPVDSGEQAP